MSGSMSFGLRVRVVRGSRKQDVMKVNLLVFRGVVNGL
jgi:hypothetical protein